MKIWSTASGQRRVLLLTVLVVLWAGVMEWQISFFQHSETQSVYHKKIMSIELACSTKEFEKILGWGGAGSAQVTAVGNAKAVRANTWLDFLLIVLYWGWFWDLAGLYREQAIHWAGGIRVLASAGAVLDVAEDIGILAQIHLLLHGGAASPLLPLATHYVSAAKWGSLLLAAVSAGVLLLCDRRSGRWRVITTAAGVLVISSAVKLGWSLLAPFL
jgi:hypothetical protein